jgi:hypothetical protein
MTRLHVHAASGADTPTAIAALEAEMAAHAFAPRMIFAFYGCEQDDERLHAFLARRFPGAALIGGSSSGGLMTHRGLMGQDSIGLMLVDDEDGDYGVAGGALEGDIAQVAENLLRQALADCGCAGELPELIWIYQAPGHEEAVIEGLRRVVGDRCPIVGGSSADDDCSGRWRQLAPAGPMSAGLVVGVLFPSSRTGFAFQGGYEPAGPNGVVTGIGFKAEGPSGVVTAMGVECGREIRSIDGRPAAEVYDEWIGNRISAKLGTSGSILCDTTMFPLAVDAGRVDGVAHYLLIHPEAVTAAGALTTFRNVEVGMRLYAMKGDRQRLVDRAGRVAAQAQSELGAAGTTIAGGLVVYCAGCKLAIGEDIGQVARTVAQTLGDVPFIGCFTYGEQGHLVGRNVHGNLMISTVAFSR